MKTYLIKTRGDLSDWFAKIHIMKSDFYPITLQVFKGDKKHRSLEANAISHVWYREIAQQAEDRSALDVKRECKLSCGVPILRAESEKFRLMYDKIVGEHDYQTQIEMMDYLPVTSKMTVPQMSDYLDAVYYMYSTAGFFIVRHQET